MIAEAVYHAYLKHAEATGPWLDVWEKEWQKNPQRVAQPKLLPVNLRSLPDASTDGEAESPLIALAQSN